MAQVLYNIGNVEIVKQVNTYLLLSKGNSNNIKILLNSLHINYDLQGKNEFILKINSFQTLEQILSKNDNLLSYEIVEIFIKNLMAQIESLEKLNKTIIFIEPRDIVLLNKNTFLFINNSKIVKTEKNMFSLRNTNIKNSYVPPEILNNNVVSKLFLKSACYYSVGLLSYNLLFNNLDIKNIQKNMLPIYQTKIYFFILRCLNKDPKKRFMLFI